MSSSTSDKHNNQYLSPAIKDIHTRAKLSNKEIELLNTKNNDRRDSHISVRILQELYPYQFANHAQNGTVVVSSKQNEQFSVSNYSFCK
jgi:hypothetical protein